jgi:ubiquinone/menaquinone biosynthesis C-methylase UbiE
MAKNSQTRFEGAKSEEYQLIRQVMPHYKSLQRWVGRLCAQHCDGRFAGTMTSLDIGCGDGCTSDNIMRTVPTLPVVAIDPEPNMIAQASENLREFVNVGRCQIVQADALGYLLGIEDNTFDIVASALTLHNLEASHRLEVHRHIWRALKPEGIFINADKYAPHDEQARFDALAIALKRFFDTLLPLRKYSLLQDWVLHGIADQAPDRCMRQDDAVRELSGIGFVDITIHDRENMEAVLSARKAASTTE